ncbi:phage holin family protein [Klebsiella aerogenes]|uniref:phage holin family protein n=1 Tax=Klebsiella aerogenes TaxID=548 RepID=UPI001BCE40B9|nr:phage holin family protein [Klebsiella aerogenes]
MVTPNDILLLLSAVSCALTAITLGTFQRNGATHKRLPAFFAWLLIVACGSVTILIMTGHYTVANPAETAIDVALCIAVISARGNVMRIFKPRVEQ